MSRAFAPFAESAIATRTRLTLLKPESGDATLPIGRAAGFLVEVGGRIPDPSKPDALRILYRYGPKDPYEERLLQRAGSTYEWGTTILAAEVHNGFWYRIAGGDSQTPEYRVAVRSVPLVTGFEVTYHYRPYLRRPDRMSRDPNLEDLRGTE